MAGRWYVWIGATIGSIGLSLVALAKILPTWANGGPGPSVILGAAGNFTFVLICASASFACLGMFLRFARTAHPIVDSLAANAETWALARMRRLLRQALPEVRGIVAYCDPIERRDECGELVKRGHVGTIYKAGNAQYRGRSSARMLWLSPSGASFADRTLAKVRLGETGERYALERLAAMDAPRRCTGEGGAEYIRRLQDEGWLRRVKHPGHFVFTWPDGRAGGGP